jgi:exosortase A-associated hydrolase 1
MAMNYVEQPICFPCGGEELLGIVAVPKACGKIGVLVLVGGPQYRVGSHRQFLLLARALAEAGYPTMRFDFRGMGDSSGDLHNFEQVNEDIGAALKAFQTNCPDIERFVLWGLCDAASAALLYLDATKDARVNGLVLLNPWVRSEATLAQTHIKHYYGQRLFQAEFWRKLFSGQLGFGRALGGFLKSLMDSRSKSAAGGDQKSSFQQTMARAICDFKGRVLLIMSGNDFTAREFLEYVGNSANLSAAMQGRLWTRIDIADADHTFSSISWRTVVETATVSWLGRIL